MPPKSTRYRDVGTKDSSPDIPKVNRSASKWRKEDLHLLSVDYQYCVFDDIQFGIEDADLPTGLLESMCFILEKLNYSHRKSMLTRSSLLIWPSSKIVRVIEKSSKCLRCSTSANLIQHTYLSPPFSHDFGTRPIRKSHLRRHLDKPSCLRIQIVLGRSASSSSSTESKQEPYAQNVAIDFLKTTYATVAEWMEDIEWINPESKLYLPLRMSLFCRPNHGSALEKMEIPLGKAQLVKAIDDGGISMYLWRDSTSAQLSQRVILSVEVLPS